MRLGASHAFSPAVISNFFAIHTDGLSLKPADYSRVGATGGGFTLSKGVYTRARTSSSSSNKVLVTVNGDPTYPALTTRKAVGLLLRSATRSPHRVELSQKVEVEIGAGFGSSSASALSAVMAVASALDLALTKEQVAMFAHEADIVRRTGLGTVSSTYDQAGAALVVAPGGPGIAKLARVMVPGGLTVLTGSMPRRQKPQLLASKRAVERINELGARALRRASDLELRSLLSAGHEFACELGQMSEDVRRLVEAALKAGALGASQNMVGNSMHAVVKDADLKAVSSAMSSASRRADIRSFKIGGRLAEVLPE